MSYFGCRIELARSWPRSWFALGTFALALWLPAFAADESALLQDGLYEVAVSLELPHLEALPAKTVATICVSQTGAGGTHGLAVLSQNNPLGSCPASNVRQDQEHLKFDILCEGKNAAQARATYTLLPENFKGRIEIKMGGKNMTMTETQRGHRIGPCERPPRS